jgi:general secretion pathway protein D
VVRNLLLFRSVVGRRILVRAGWLAGCISLAGVILCACNPQTLIEGPKTSADAVDVIHSADLLPRYPLNDSSLESQGGVQRPAVYNGKVISSDASVTPPLDGAHADSGGDGFELNFDNTPITGVAKVILSDILGLGYTIDPRVQGTISLSSGRPIPKRDVLFVLESALRASNVVMVHGGAGEYRLIPLADALGNGSVDRSATVEPGYGITAVPLRYVSVQTITRLLEGFATKPEAIRSDSTRNMILIQGNGIERKAALETIASFDSDWLRGQSVAIYPVHNSTPEPVIAEIEKIMDSGEGGLGQNMVKLQPINRLNAILVVAGKPNILKTAMMWISRLDKSNLTGTGVKVYRVRYGDAKQIARLLNEMYTGVTAGSLDSPTNQIAPGAGLTGSSSGPATGLSTSDRLTGGQASLAGAPRPQQAANAASRPIPAVGPLAGGVEGGKSGSGIVLPGVRITADVNQNSILIFANEESYRVIQKALQQIDRPQLQVAIDATIAEVDLNDNLTYGVQFFLKSTNVGAPPDTGSAINSIGGAVINRVLPGFNLLVGSAATPQFILNELQTVTDVKILSNPSLVVSDNGTATLQVGDQVPITTGTATVLSANNAVVNTINYQNTGIILKVVPRINFNGNVQLDIEQEISAVSTASATGSLTPTISERKVKSTIAVMDGQTVLLAGLISQTNSRSRQGIPVLDKIPGVGDLFSQTNKSTVRTELIIFIRPQIIRDNVDAYHVAEEMRAKLRDTSVGSAGHIPKHP